MSHPASPAVSSSVEAPLRLHEVDRRIWEEELADFVPRKIFDVHSHIYRWAFNLDPQKETGPYKKFAGEEWAEATWDLLDACDRALFPGREVHRLSFPFPFADHCDFAASNEFIARETAVDRRSASLMLVHPGMTEDEIEGELAARPHLGFKPYRVYSRTGDAVNCRLTDFMTEPQIAIADRHGLIIMMHLSKRDAIADPENLADLCRLSAQYPRVQWILAHCARSYSAWAIEKGAAALRTLPNVWYDVSSVCESDAMEALMAGVGAERVMYGSDDIPVGVLRGKYVAFGFAWAYLSEKNHSLNLSHCDGRMTFTRYEQLRAMRRAAIRLGLTRDQIEALFCGTAEKLVAEARGGLVGRRP
jgi:glutamate-1-semialdehyde 2,1-aminomutase